MATRSSSGCVVLISILFMCDFSVALDLSRRIAGYPVRFMRDSVLLCRPGNAHQPEKEQCHWML
jgi:hypothetical protein